MLAHKILVESETPLFGSIKVPCVNGLVTRASTLFHARRAMWFRSSHRIKHGTVETTGVDGD